LRTACWRNKGSWSEAAHSALGDLGAGVHAYDNYPAFKGWSEASFGEVTAAERLYFRSELARHALSASDKQVLELGFGNGAFLAFARGEGAHVRGVELQTALVERAVGAGYACYACLDQLLADGPPRFDLIVALDLLEHLQPAESIDLLRQLRASCVHANSKLLARFPNGDSPFSLPMHNGDYSHRIHLGAKAVTRICMEAGWRVSYLGEPAWVADTLQRKLIITTKNAARLAFEAVLKALYFGRHGPSTLSQNYILVAEPA
jgi:2-polyprenyl-3-methyl-5-hydroxy-6-metoxy-1,4-benzoquinol methylase